MGRACLSIPMLFCLLRSAKVGIYLAPRRARYLGTMSVVNFRGPCDLLSIQRVFLISVSLEFSRPVSLQFGNFEPSHHASAYTQCAIPECHSIKDITY